MLKVRRYGVSGPVVIVLHGGPAAVGDMGPVARELAADFRVLEPWQRGSSSVPLSVARHIDDLQALIGETCAPEKPAIVGHSWGAMLALAHAAAHPGSVGPVVLVGCGTFDKTARARMWELLDERTDDAMRQALMRLRVRFPNISDRLEKRYALTKKLYFVDPLPEEHDPDVPESLDVQAHMETWKDMMRLIDEGVYPAAFAGITSPVLMLHGADDPHPGRMIRDNLQPLISQLEYHQWDRCGHYPWRERQVRSHFFRKLRQWLLRDADY